MLKVFAVYRGLHDLVIAETPEQAAAYVYQIFSGDLATGEDIAEVCSKCQISLRWGDEYDPEFNLEETGLFTLTEDGIDPVCKTAQEWIDLLGAGLLAVEDGGCSGPKGIFYRSFWKRSRAN